VPSCDAQLVRRAWAGDSSAFDELVRKHRGAVEGLATRLTRDPEQARDLAQDSLLRAYERLGQLRDPDHFSGWLLSIARSVCANWLQTTAIRRRLALVRPSGTHEVAPPPGEKLSQADSARQVRRLVASLPEPYRSCLEQYYFEGRRMVDIAAQMGAPVGTLKARVHHARRRLREEVMDVSRTWYGECDWQPKAESAMTVEQMAKAAVERYGLKPLRSVGSVYRPHSSLGIGLQTPSGRYRLWRYHGFMTPELVELQHAILQHLCDSGVPCKRLVATPEGETWQEIGGQLVALFEWFTGAPPDLRDKRDLVAVASLHARWTQAMADFAPPIPDWQQLASRWRPRKDWAWVLPTEDLPQVPSRMGFLAAVRDIEDPPAHHDRMLEQVRHTEKALSRFAQQADELNIAALPRGLNHGVFLFGLTDWEPAVTDGDDFVYEARVADLARLIYAIYDRGMPDYQARDMAVLALDTYTEQIDLSRAELKAIPTLARAQGLYYDVFHVLLYLTELSAPDRGECWAAEKTSDWTRRHTECEKAFEGLAKAIG